MKLIFLDVHGVLTNASSRFVYGSKDRLDPVSVRLVDTLARCCEASIVITSSIRIGLSDEQLMVLLKALGGKRLVKHVVGVTAGPAQGDDNYLMRGMYVADYRKAHGNPPYVVLDDKPRLFLPEQNVVAVDGDVGFKIQHYNDAVEYLCSSKA